MELNNIIKSKIIATMNIIPFTKTLSPKDVDFVSMSLLKSLYSLNNSLPKNKQLKAIIVNIILSVIIIFLFFYIFFIDNNRAYTL
jgi:hypothetical protein